MVILVVEDDGLINWMATEELQQAGYSVISAHTADEAIAVLESRNDIALLFTDIDLPGSLDGLKLAAAVCTRWPPVRIIVTSGKHFPSSDTMPAQSRFLPKPYGMSGLLQTVRSLL